MICENCPFGKLVQTDSFIWMVDCSIKDCLMARKDECNFPDNKEEKKMICKDCPFCNCYEDYYYDDYIQLHTTDYYYFCPLDDKEHNANDECFFPKTIQKKGV